MSKQRICIKITDHSMSNESEKQWRPAGMRMILMKMKMKMKTVLKRIRFA